jgi:hypothetical protein
MARLKIQTLRLTGLAGLAGAALLLAGDWLLLATFTSGREFTEDWLSILAGMPAWRLTAGGVIGPIGAWLYVVGFWQLYVALVPAGRGIAFCCFAGFSLSFIWLAGAFHTSFPFLADAWSIRGAAAGGGGIGQPAIAALDRTFAYAGLLYYVGLVPAFVGAGVLAYAIIAQRTHYPGWFVLLNPALLYFLSLAFRWMPAPFGGLLALSAGNLVFLVFFGASTIVLWDGGSWHQFSDE